MVVENYLSCFVHVAAVLNLYLTGFRLELRVNNGRFNVVPVIEVHKADAAAEAKIYASL